MGGVKMEPKKVVYLRGYTLIYNVRTTGKHEQLRKEKIREFIT